jgi:hypothetical protein
VTALAYAGCFLALAAVAGLAAASGSRWLVRLPVLAATPLLALVVWWQLAQRDGWPASATPAENAEFVAGLVRAPSPGDPGAIYLWTQPPGSGTPRAYRVDYSPDLEREVARAARAEKKGAHVVVRTSSKRKGHGAQAASSSTMHFVRLPPAAITEKGQVDG